MSLIFLSQVLLVALSMIECPLVCCAAVSAQVLNEINLVWV